MKAGSLRRRLLALVLATAMLGGATGLLLTWYDARHEIGELLDAHLAQSAALMAAQTLDDLEDNDRIEARPTHRYAPRVVFQLWHDGDLLLKSANAPDVPLAREASGFGWADAGAQRWRIYAITGRESDQLLIVGERAEARDEIVRASVRSALTPMLVTLPLLALALWLVIGLGLRPLGELGRVLARRRPDDRAPLGLRAPAEVQPLVDALDTLFARVGDLLDSERRFTADAAHELRTPLAAIRVQVQVALGTLGSPGGSGTAGQGTAAEHEAARDALQAALSACDRAARLLEQLLQLARADSEAAALAAAGRDEHHDLAALCRQLLAEQLGNDAQARIELDAPDRLPCAGDGAVLAIALRNLIDNACRHTPRGSAVRVRLTAPDSAGADEARAGIAIEDAGAGLGEDEMARLGERFWRAPGTRAPGSGLGWSIVRRLARQQDWTLHIDRSPDLGGLRVRLGVKVAAKVATTGR